VCGSVILRENLTEGIFGALFSFPDQVTQWRAYPLPALSRQDPVVCAARCFMFPPESRRVTPDLTFTTDPQATKKA
jgi:hypothetical protein